MPGISNRVGPWPGDDHQFLMVLPVFSVYAIRSCVFGSPQRLRNASRSRSSRYASGTSVACGTFTAGENPRELAADRRVVVADAARTMREMDTQRERRQHVGSTDGDRRRRSSRHVPRGSRLHEFARVRVQPAAVHADAVAVAEVAERACVRRTRGHHTEANRLERLLDERQRVGLPRRSLLVRAPQHLLGPAAGRNEADTNLDEPHVRLGRGLHARGVQGHFGGAAERQPVDGVDHRHLRVTKRQDGALEHAHHGIDRVPFALLGVHQHEHQVGAGRERLALRGEDEADAVAFGALDARLQHRQRVATDGVHLRVQLDGEDAVAGVEHRSRGIGW